MIPFTFARDNLYYMYNEDNIQLQTLHNCAAPMQICSDRTTSALLYPSVVASGISELKPARRRPNSYPIPGHHTHQRVAVLWLHGQ